MSINRDIKKLKENGGNLESIYKNILECPKCEKFLHYKFIANNCVCKCGYKMSPEITKEVRKAFSDYINRMRELKIKDMEVSYNG